eukprot:5012398-Heterocapsa_arctica.AAC.1
MDRSAPPGGSWQRARRSGAARRAQVERAQARTVQRLLKGFAELSAHRGCQPSKLGAALAKLLDTDRRGTPGGFGGVEGCCDDGG